MGDEKFLPSSYGLETTEATLAHYEAWAGSYDAEIGEENRYAQPGRCSRALLSKRSTARALRHLIAPALQCYGTPALRCSGALRLKHSIAPALQ